MLNVIAVANAVLWSGVIFYLLLRLMSNQGQIEAQIRRLEEQDKTEIPRQR